MNTEEKALLLQEKFVGETVISRLEENGFDSFEKIADAGAQTILNTISDTMKSTCWKNSHQAQQSILNVVRVAKEHTG